MSDNHNKDSGYIEYNGKDAKYGGAKTVVEAELEHLQKRRNSRPDDLKGLALSGGGIRSASFCLGVVQVLARHNKLKTFDYMSTVSGGGYLGGSLSWLWSGKWKEGTGCDRKFGTDKDNFPYGVSARYSSDDTDLDKDQAALMRHLRQHGKYLIPGNGITSLSLLSVVLRSISMGLVTILVLVSLIFHALYLTHVFEPGYLLATYALDAGVLGMVIYLASLLLYGIFVIVYKQNAENSYLWRRLWERIIKYILIVAVAIVLVAVVVELRKYIDTRVQSAGGWSAMIGALFAWRSQQSKKKSMFSIIPKSLLVYVGVIVMFIGLLVVSDQLANAIKELKFALPGHVVAAGVVLMFSYLIPINKVSIHRYYRDRLMETFMPDVSEVLNQGETHVAKKANETSVSDCLSDVDNDMPYHIINCNVILVESKVAKFRGRGGDNFILSPLFSGSNATGWLNSNQFANDSVTLPTAMAISGAAANPDAGVAGQGLTINPLISVLMSIFNLRLGYWTVNPDIRLQRKQSANPNYLTPGFREIVNRKNLNEDAAYIQLSDGGHFENLGIYELIRRHSRLIVCCDGEEDKKFVFGSLSNVIEKVRVDFGVIIKISADDLESLRYKENDKGKISFASQAHLVADIVYPNSDVPGKLIYIKTTLPEGLSAEVMGYKNTHPDFPDETTIDQFFDEKQMEAYRMLGMHIAESVVMDESINW